MIALILKSRVLTTLAAIVITFTTTWAWCYVDKVYAVRAAVEGLATKVETKALKAEAEEARRLAAAATIALRSLNAEVDRAEADAQVAKEELEKYEKENVVNSDCLVDDQLASELHNR